VQQRIIRSGARLKISGVGFNEVIGGYFGEGTLGSATNPLWSVINRSHSYLELQTTTACKQEGILMLSEPVPAAGGSPPLILPDSVIRAACYPATPSGFILGSESAANGVVYAQAGAMVNIRGTNMKAVTHVLDQMNNKYPTTYATNVTHEWVTFNLPSPTGPNGQTAFQFFLANSLTDPIENGRVAGSIQLIAPPTWARISPAWAEPGQKVTINGQNLKYTAMPTVTVAGVPAQILSATPLVVDFRIPAGVTSGPVVLTNEGGSITLNTPFTSTLGTPHPGFFVVSGPSVITSILPPTAGDTIVIQGQNLARVIGICVAPTYQPGSPSQLFRTPNISMGYATTNTEMRVSVPFQVAPGTPVKLFVAQSPNGDYFATDYACSTTGGSTWP
jgi:hypothetical protein